MDMYGLFEIGDIVQLKSGPPRMVVENVTSYPEITDGYTVLTPRRRVYTVVWIVYGTSEVKRDTFDHRLLVLAVDDRRSC